MSIPWTGAILTRAVLWSLPTRTATFLPNIWSRVVNSIMAETLGPLVNARAVVPMPLSPRYVAGWLHLATRFAI